MLKLILAIGTGSFIGGVSRYLIGRFVQQHVWTAFPFGTLVVNLSGCFLIGLFYGLSDRGSLTGVEWKMFLTVGFCGGFTTFSTFANENMAMLRDGNFLYFALYTSSSVFLGLLATYLGSLLIKAL